MKNVLGKSVHSKNFGWCKREQEIQLDRIGRCIRHVDVRSCFLRKLKELNVIETEWISNAKMSSDIFTKNVSGPDFEKHVPMHVSGD